MATTSPLLLPTPLPTSTISLGQLLTDPLNLASPSFLSSSTSLSTSTTHPSYRDVLTHDPEGRLLTSLSNQPLPLSSPNLLVLQADTLTTHTLQNPSLSFDALRSDPKAQSFLLSAARHNKTLYYITSLQSLSNPSFSRAIITSRENSPVPEVSPTDSVPTKLPLPIHVRRDSTMDVTETSSSSDAIFGLVLRKVRCHVSRREEPHGLEDIGLDWSYHALEGSEEEQLSIGLGGVVSVKELRGLAGMEWVEEEERVGSDVSYETDEDGEGGF